MLFAAKRPVVPFHLGVRSTLPSRPETHLAATRDPGTVDRAKAARCIRFPLSVMARFVIGGTAATRFGKLCKR